MIPAEGRSDWVDTTPPPGSPLASSLGCKCPCMDNAFGKGQGGRFWIRQDCPIHGTDRIANTKEDKTDG